MKYIVFIFLLMFSITANSAVRWNPHLRTWEGNICMSNVGWQVVNWQPLGSICRIQLPGLPPMQGVIINA